MFSRGSFFQGIFSFLFLVSFSCTIIEEGDITSLDQLSALKWKAIEIVQNTNSGNSSTVAQLVYDSAKNVVDPVTGATITRKVKFSLPSLAGKKLKLRSKSSLSTNFYIAYKATNQPVKFWIQEGDSVIESYNFKYNATNYLYKVITRINPVDGLKETVNTSDSLIYDNSNSVASIIRKSADATKAGTIGISYQNGLISNIGFKYTYQIQSGNCPNGSLNNLCGGYQILQQFQNSNPMINYLFENINAVESKIELTDRRFDFGNTNCQGCGRELDTFYLHPLMLTKNQIVLGDQLLMIYMVDWWVPGTAAVSNAQLSKNDVVTLNFQYGH